MAPTWAVPDHGELLIAIGDVRHDLSGLRIQNQPPGREGGEAGVRIPILGSTLTRRRDSETPRGKL